MSGKCAISVVIPTYRRQEQLGVAIEKIMRCDPPVAEIIVHVDGGDNETESWLKSRFPTVLVLTSSTRIGPGGGRNKLVSAASYEIVVSFDDDSYPLDTDYFARVCELFRRRPDAAAVGSRITDKGCLIPEANQVVCRAVHFGGGGAAYRRNDFLACGGYLPLAVAYGMEEVDLCIRFVDQGKKIYYSPWLRVFHDNDLSHHADPAITSSSVANQALLVYLRYPFRYWPYGVMQVLHRIVWLIHVGRVRGLASGLLAIPGYIWRRRDFRVPVSPGPLSAFLRARRTSAPFEPLALKPQ